MATDLERSYRVSERTARRAARNFYFAFLSLPRDQRRAVYALYAFCHEADDIADEGTEVPSSAGENSTAVRPNPLDTTFGGENSTAVLSVGDVQDVGSSAGSRDSADLERRRAELKAMRARLACAGRGKPTTPRDLALADAIHRFGVREEDLRDVISGVEMDLTPAHIQTYDELRTYCYHVASAVGLATLPILTNAATPTNAMREAAIDLGLGMQYVNILRDVDEDLSLGRIYLPEEEFAGHGVERTQMEERRMSDGLRDLLAAHAARATDLLDRGRRLLALLPRRSRACPWLLSEIYSRILSRIIAGDCDVFGGRVSLPTREKLWLLLSSSWRRT